MGTILWKNLTTIPAAERDDLGADYDELGHLRDGHPQADVIFVYLRTGRLIEIRPATSVRLTGDTLAVLNGKEVVARYPRERVIQATHQPVESSPFW